MVRTKDITTVAAAMVGLVLPSSLPRSVELEFPFGVVVPSVGNVAVSLTDTDTEVKASMIMELLFAFGVVLMVTWPFISFAIGINVPSRILSYIM